MQYKQTNKFMKTILDEKTICDEYQSTNIGIEALALKYHVGKKKINEILANNNIPHKKKGAQRSKETFLVSDWSIKKYNPSEGFHYMVYDPKTDFVSKDINNNGGVLTSYIEKEYNMPTPTLYDRRMHYMRTGNYWWEQWLSVKLVKNEEVKKCPYCDWETIDIENKSGAFEQHLLKCHNITKFQYIEQFPEEKKYFALINPALNRQMEDDENDFVVCHICGRKLARINAHHLKLHSITTEEYIKKYGSQSLLSNNYKEIAKAAGIKANMNSTPNFHSKIETEIKEFIKSLGFEANTDRKILNGKEIDILIPPLKIAFEIDGLRWHNEITKDNNYHLRKTEQCKDCGISLYHIFEDEWEFKRDIVESRIRNILNCTQNKIFARKCQIKTVDKPIAMRFLDENHLQGKCGSIINYGLYYNNELVSLMTFGKLRKNMGRNDTGNTYELIRFCNKLNTNVVGGASKLFKHFIKEFNPSSVISYADRRWSNGNLYTKLNFSHVHNSRPNYFYIIGHKRKNRFGFRKDILVKEGYDANKSEHQIMFDRGIYRIYDCGTMLFEYKNIYNKK